MNVLILPSFYTSTELPVRGIFFKEQALALQRNGQTVSVAYVEPRSLCSFAFHKIRENHFQTSLSYEDGLPTLRAHDWNLLTQTSPGAYVWSWFSEKLVDQFIRRFGPPHIIHAHNSLWAGYTASKVTRTYNIPFVITEHSTGFPLNSLSTMEKYFAKKSFSKADAIICVSQGLANAVQPYCPKRHITVVPNVTQTDFFILPPQRPQTPPFVFLGVAHLVERKGFRTMINAFAQVLHTNSNVRLEIGGDGPERVKLHELCKTLGIERSVLFLGPLSREQVRDAMWRAHAFVLPSFLETFGVVLLEAMSTGLPVIATKCGGPEYFVDSKSGVIIEAGDEHSLAEAMQTVMHSAHFSAKCIRRRIVDNFSEKVFAESLMSIYENILRDRK
jgi:glycosyltransferase involved in cell wall biosynthesis